MIRIGIAAAVGISASESAGKTVEHIVGTEGVGSAEPGSHGNFICSAVSVQISTIAESFQTVNPFVNSGGNFLPYLIQPCLVNQQGAAGQDKTVHFLDIREAVGMAIGSGYFGPVIFAVIQNLFQVGHIFVNQPFRRQEDILICVLNYDIAGFSVAEVPEYIGKLFAGGKHQIYFLLGTFGRNRLPVEFNTGILKPYLAHFQILNRYDSVRRIYDQCGDFAVFFLKGSRVLDDRKRAVQVQDSSVHSLLFFLGQAAVRS